MRSWLSNIYKRAVDRKIPIASNDTLTIIKGILEKKKPVYCVEFWTAIGRSAAHIARTLAPWNWTLISFETSYPSYHKARQILAQEAIYTCNVYHHNIDTVDLSSYLYCPVDFVFIDAQKESYSDYFHKILPYLSNNATIVFDDIHQYASKVDGLEDLLEKAWWALEYHSTDNNTDQLLIATTE